MASAENKDVVKRRLLVLLKLLYDKTDEDNQLTTFQIMEYLSDNNVPANRKTLKNDIDVLQEAGFDIVTVCSKPNRYFWGDRGFELPELKLLIDAVSSSRFITDKKSSELKKKLTHFAGIGHREELDRRIYAVNRVKTNNEFVFYNVDTINRAIVQNRKISFLYTEYNGNKELVLRNDGEPYLVSPYALFWNDDFYYLVGFSDKHGKVSSFRVDRILYATVTDQISVTPPPGFELEEYSKQIYEMYDGEIVEVVLECRNDLMKYVIDRYGEDVSTSHGGTDTFFAKIEAALSPTFYAWVFRFGGGIRILSPPRAVSEIIEMSKALLDREQI